MAPLGVDAVTVTCCTHARVECRWSTSKTGDEDQIRTASRRELHIHYMYGYVIFITFG